MVRKIIQFDSIGYNNIVFMFLCTRFNTTYRRVIFSFHYKFQWKQMQTCNQIQTQCVDASQMQLNTFNAKSNTTCHTVHYYTSWVVNSTKSNTSACRHICKFIYNMQLYTDCHIYDYDALNNHTMTTVWLNASNSTMQPSQNWHTYTFGMTYSAILSDVKRGRELRSHLVLILEARQSLTIWFLDMFWIAPYRRRLRIWTTQRV